MPRSASPTCFRRKPISSGPVLADDPRYPLGSLCALIPGTGPTIASFVSYATEKEDIEDSECFGHGAIKGVACPEAVTSSVQGDFIPTMKFRHSRRYRHALVAGRSHYSRHRSGPTAHQPARGHLLGPDRELLDRQHPFGRPQRARPSACGSSFRASPYRYLYPSANVLRRHWLHAANNDMFQVA